MIRIIPAFTLALLFAGIFVLGLPRARAQPPSPSLLPSLRAFAEDTTMTPRPVGPIAFLSLSLILVLGVAGQQQAAKIPRRIGMLTGTGPTEDRLRREAAFRRALLERGYIEGQDITIVYRRAGGDFSQIGRLAKELVQDEQVEVIVASSTEAVAAAKEKTKTIPIVMTNVGDPVQRGFVKSLAKPNTNITGLSNVSDLLVGKLLELLIEAVPQLRKVAVIHNPLQPAHEPQLQVLRGLAAALSITLHEVGLNRADQFDGAFNDVVTAQPQALIVLSSALHFAHSQRIADFARTHRLPAISWARTYATNGLLISYGADEEEIFRRAADYVDRLLKGANPADMPVEQPMAFELVINLRTARALDLTLPSSLLLLAKEVIR
jgi:putative tryptophan/tyrosine transport system substrate-binding protein